MSRNIVKTQKRTGFLVQNEANKSTYLFNCRLSPFPIYSLPFLDEHEDSWKSLFNCCGIEDEFAETLEETTPRYGGDVELVKICKGVRNSTFPEEKTDIEGFHWKNIHDLVKRYEKREILFERSFYVIKAIRKELNIKFEYNQNWEAAEVASGVFAFPLLSATLKPFDCTNLIVFIGSEKIIVIDPSAQKESEDELKQIIAGFPPNKAIDIVITHYHHDHHESLYIFNELKNVDRLLAHSFTLSRLNPVHISNFKQISISDELDFDISPYALTAKLCEGHTAGHIIVFDKLSRILCPGDHVVGFGSAVLDSRFGDMSQYMKSSSNLLELNSSMAIPAHGPINFHVAKLLHEYIQHRTKRESDILNAYNHGHKTLPEIVQAVYSTTPQHLWKVAERNVFLHLKKLEQEHKIDPPITPSYNIS